MKFHLLNRCQLMTAAAAAVVVYIIVTNLPAAEELCMYIILRWDTAIKNCNCCGGRRHISSSTTTIWLPRLICCYLEQLMTVAAVVYTIIINFPVAKELCRYIILQWDAKFFIYFDLIIIFITLHKWCCKRRTSYSGDYMISLWDII